MTLFCRNIVVFGQDKLWVIELALRRDFGDPSLWTEDDERLWSAVQKYCTYDDID